MEIVIRFLKKLLIWSISIIILLFITIQILIYFACYAPPSVKRIESTFGLSFDNAHVDVINGEDACDMDNDTFVKATITGDDYFIRKIEDKYSLSYTGKDEIYSYSYEVKDNLKTESLSIACDKKNNICTLEFVDCC